MARGVNKVILIGNLGDEPLCRTTHSGCSVTNISMVTNEVRRNIDTGETTEYAEWHRVVMWGKLADIARQYLHKGSQIYVEGKLRTRSFMDKQGQKRSVTEIVADEMQMLGSRATTQSSLPQGNPYRGGMNQAQGNVQTRSPYGTQNAGGYGSMNQGGNVYGNQGGYNSQGYGNDSYGAPQGYGNSLGDDTMVDAAYGADDGFNKAPAPASSQDADKPREPSVSSDLNDEIPF
ncbi:MAG TPA: single-stranded DNA-binding protein [Candidatus Avisuccinivibrio pullicola]|nr:single-stranded DNA-binding protein [Candidatus Avisuccinivibrio pullicola]